MPIGNETFATFFGNTPLADLPLTTSDQLLVLQNALTKHASSTSIGRIRLNGPVSYFVSVLGSDSNPGTALLPWATLQHALLFIAANIDFAGFTVTVNLGAGVFAGAGLAGAVGGGTIVIQGSGSTAISAGPNDGVFNFGECLTIQVSPSPTNVTLQGVTIRVPPSAFAIASYNPSVLTITNVSFDLSAANSSSVIVSAQQTGAIINISQAIAINAGTCLFGIDVFSGVVLDTAQWTLSGTPNFVLAFAFSSAYGLILEGSLASYSGAATGTRFIVANNGCISSSNVAPGILGPNFYPGNFTGTVDASSAYDGFPGPLPTTDTSNLSSYTLIIGDSFKVVEMNNGGANTVTVPANASVAFEIGTKIWVTQIGAGATTVVAAGGVTGHNFGAVGGQWQSVKLYKRGTDEWVQTNS